MLCRRAEKGQSGKWTTKATPAALEEGKRKQGKKKAEAKIKCQIANDDDDDGDDDDDVAAVAVLRCAATSLPPLTKVDFERAK